jgi:hypothetical protein
MLEPEILKPLIIIDFELGELPYIYKDRLIMFKDEYDALSEEQIASLKQERYDRWYNHITTISAAVEEIPEIPTEEII